MNEIKDFVDELNKNTGKAIEVVTGRGAFYIVNERLREIANNGGFYVLLNKSDGNGTFSVKKFSKAYVADAGEIIVANQDQVYSGKRDCILTKVSAYPNMNLKGVPFLIKKIVFNGPTGQVTIEKKAWDLLKSENGNYVFFYVIETPKFNYLIGTAVLPVDQAMFEEGKTRITANINLTENHVKIVNELGYMFDEKTGLISNEDANSWSDHTTLPGEQAMPTDETSEKDSTEKEQDFIKYLKEIEEKGDFVSLDEAAKILDIKLKDKKSEQEPKEEQTNKYGRYSKMTQDDTKRNTEIGEAMMKKVMNKAMTGGYSDPEDMLADVQKVLKIVQAAQAEREAPKQRETPQGCGCGCGHDMSSPEEFLKAMGIEICTQDGEPINSEVLQHIMGSMGVKKQTTESPKREAPKQEVPKKAPQQSQPSFEDLLKAMGGNGPQRQSAEAGRGMQIDPAMIQNLMKMLGGASAQQGNEGGQGMQIDPAMIQNLMKMLGGITQQQGNEGGQGMPEFNPEMLQNMMKMFGGMNAPQTQRANTQKDNSMEIDLDDLRRPSKPRSNNGNSDEVNDLMAQLQAAIERDRKSRMG